MTPYNVHNKCVQDKCDGILSEVDPDKALASNYYRRQYKTKKIESIVVKEHTAQLDRKKAKQYQQDFKNKKINILSCSTTFEMGIDIGDLETVFMRNVPPSPANYVQRAGRAGRRKDSAAYILTYCGTGSHDYTYFCSPEKMISGVIKPPYFNVVNHKIIVRHLMATCLGFFFRQHPDYFTSIDELVFGNALEEFKNYISSHPSDLNIYINEKILPGDTYRAYHNFKWFDEIEGNDEKIKLIRDRNYEALADNDAIWLFEFVYKMIANRGFVGKELEKRVEGAYNLLDYPVRSINAQILKSKEELDKIQAFMFHQRNKMLTSPNYNLAWLKYMQEQIQKAMDKGVEVFGQMREIRNEEITDKGVDFFDRMTDEEYAAYQLQDEVGDRAYDIQSEKEEVKKLKQREREIRGIPESIRDIIINDYEPRNDFTQAEIKELLRIKRRCDSLYDESYRQAISEIAAERGMSEEDVAKTKYISNETFSSSEEVLKKAIESTTE